MTVIIVAIMGLSLIAASIFSSFFLSKYYKKTKQDSIKKVYNELIKITQDDSDIENSDDVSILNNICEKAGATMIVVVREILFMIMVPEKCLRIVGRI